MRPWTNRMIPRWIPQLRAVQTVRLPSTRRTRCRRAAGPGSIAARATLVRAAGVAWAGLALPAEALAPARSQEPVRKEPAAPAGAAGGRAARTRPARPPIRSARRAPFPIRARVQLAVAMGIRAAQAISVWTMGAVS